MPKRLLIVDDSTSIRNSLTKALKASNLFSSIRQAENGIQALEILLKEQIDFVISDVAMPNLDGYKLVAMIRSSEKYKDLPVILLTGQKETEGKIKGLTIGANDYVTKPFDPGELLARIKNILKTKELQEELWQKNLQLENLNRELEELSITDALTGLFNRRYFDERFSIELQRSQRYKLHLACLLLDLDHFKAINDTYGHQRGDKVLQEVARLLKSKRRSHDVVARYGGEEFILFLCQTPPEEALKIAERLRSDIESFPFSQEKGIPIKATVSIGIAAYPHPDIHDCQDMIKNADNALYAAKQAGRNKVIIETSLQNNLN